ncbi:hypothetical protein [Thermaurantiacus sp.]
MLHRFALALALAFTPALAGPSLAQDAAAMLELRPGQTVRDPANARLGKIDRVNADGSVRIIFEERFVIIPADKLVVHNGNVTTSLTRREVARLR